MSASRSSCPCYSNKPYAHCCQKYHQGSLPETALALMRSRYSAYALGLVNYLIETTHPENPHFISDKKQWFYQIQMFCKQVTFEGLEILETKNNDGEAFVTFVALLSKEGKDLTFTEKSRFLKQGEAWKYIDGKIAKGRLTAEQINF